MKKSILFLAPFLLLFAITFSSCQVVGGIFKAGVWSGIAIVVAVILLIVYLITRSSKNS